jgi:transcription elongation factor GreB
MARYRPPAQKSSPYITAAGQRALRGELADLLERRREVVTHLAAAAAEGDRSENAEYIYRKKQLREIDRRAGYLQRRLPALQVVREAPAAGDRVFFGAWVTLLAGSGEERRYRIVGADEIDPGRGWISVDSPMARALLGRRLDDEVEVDTPQGVAAWCVVAIDYAPVHEV